MGVLVDGVASDCGSEIRINYKYYNQMCED
jgi:hypothetical protein